MRLKPLAGDGKHFRIPAAPEEEYLATHSLLLPPGNRCKVIPLAPQPGFRVIIRNYQHNYKKQQLSVQLLTAWLHQTRGTGTTAIRLIRWNSCHHTGRAAPSQSIKLVNFTPLRVFFNIGVYKTSGPAGIYSHQKRQNQRSQWAENDQEYTALQSAAVQPERPLYALRGLVAVVSLTIN